MHVCTITNKETAGQEFTRTIDNIIPDVRTETLPDIEELINSNEDFPDITFVDTDTTEGDTIELTAELQSRMPDSYIVLIADDGRYAVDAYRLHVDGYIARPVTPERIREEYENLLRVKNGGKDKSVAVIRQGLWIRNDDRFEVYLNGQPVGFERNKTKDMLEYLVNHDGLLIDDEELLSVLWKSRTTSNKSYLRMLKAELVRIFKDAGCEDAIIKYRGRIGIMTERINQE